MPKQSKMTAQKQPEICVIPNCVEAAQWKGLCRSCYGQASRFIREEKTTWEELNNLSLAFIADKPFTAAFKLKKGLA